MVLLSIKLASCTEQKRVKIHEYKVVDTVCNKTRYQYVFEVLNKGVKEFFSCLSDYELNDLTGITWTKASVDPRIGPYRIEEQEEVELDEFDLPQEIEAEIDAEDSSDGSSDGSSDSGGSDGGSSGGDGGGDGGD